MRRFIPITGALALAALAPVAGAAHAATPITTSWITTATKAVAPQLVGATSLGALPSSTPLRITVALPVRNATQLNNYIRSVSDFNSSAYGQSMTPGQFTAIFGPTSTQVAAVKSYLTGQGMTNVQAESNNLLVTANATAAQAEVAFHTAINQYSQHGLTIYANLTAPQVPSNLSGDVAAVMGLTNSGRMTATPHVPNVASYLQSYNPQDFWNIYHATNGTDGSGTSIAIFAEGNLNGTIKDLRTEEAANHLRQVAVGIVPAGIASPDTSGADEWDMDTQYSTGMANYVHALYLYDATTLTDSDLALGFSRFASQDLAKAGSASFGECEYQAYLDGSMVADDEIFAEAAAQGQTVFASAGDTGGFCPVAPTNGAPAGVPEDNYPSSSPYVVSAGGTSLFTTGTPSQNGGPSHVAYDSEIAWTPGGGGPSQFESQPYWQNGVTPPTSTTCVQVVACLGKNTPDVAMDADPNTGANVYINGQPTAVGGTSLSSPLALGAWARIETDHANRIGFAAPSLYHACATSGFHDITLGNTGPYPATPGWDYATGCGTFNVFNMEYYIAPPSVPLVNPMLAPPACTVATGPSNVSHPLGSNGNVDSLDILAVGFAKGAANTVTAKLLLQSLNDGPAGQPELAGDGDNWYVTFTYKGTEYWLSASYPTNTVNTSSPTSLYAFNYGTVTKSPTGGTLYNTIGSATGSVDTVHSIITITAPTSVVGSPTTGASLLDPGAVTFESVGTPAGGLLEQADGVGPGSAYKLGSTC